MAFELEELYKNVIMEHAKSPLNKGLTFDKKYKNYHLSNPVCGDTITLEIFIENDVIKDIKQDGHGCSISMSSASILSELLKEKTLTQANEIINTFYSLLKGSDDFDEEILGEAIVFKGVSKFPQRIKCATLAWKTCEEILKNQNNE